METRVDEQPDLESHSTLNVEPMQLPMHDIGEFLDDRYGSWSTRSLVAACKTD